MFFWDDSLNSHPKNRNFWFRRSFLIKDRVLRGFCFYKDRSFFKSKNGVGFRVPLKRIPLFRPRNGRFPPFASTLFESDFNVSKNRFQGKEFFLATSCQSNMGICSSFSSVWFIFIFILNHTSWDRDTTQKIYRCIL